MMQKNKNLIADAKALLATAKTCPWCDKQPILGSKRVGLRDEPSRLVFIQCPSCGIRKSICMTDSGEVAASNLARINGIAYETACAVNSLKELLALWDTRTN